MKWSPHIDRLNELLYSSGNILISFDTKIRNQRFFIGHNKNITCFDLSKDGNIIASTQMGPKALIKIWDFIEAITLSTFQTNFEVINCLTFSNNNNLLACVGVDDHKREIIVIWNLESLKEKKKVFYLYFSIRNLTMFYYISLIIFFINLSINYLFNKGFINK